MNWQLANAEKAGFPYGVVIGQNGGSAPVPTGGEFCHRTLEQDTARYDVSKKIVTCLTSSESLLASDTALTYVAPTAAVQAQQVQANPSSSRGRRPWPPRVAVPVAVSTKYPTISQPMWTAVQAALSGGKSPKAALDAAQTAAWQEQGLTRPARARADSARRPGRVPDTATRIQEFGSPSPESTAVPSGPRPCPERRAAPTGVTCRHAVGAAGTG